MQSKSKEIDFKGVNIYSGIDPFEKLESYGYGRGYLLQNIFNEPKSKRAVILFKEAFSRRGLLFCL